MATSLIPMATGSGQTQLGREQLDSLETLSVAWANVKRLFAAHTQQKDGSAGDATDHVTPATVFGYLDAPGGSVSSATAKAAYDEVNSMIGNAGPSLEQCCAKFKQ